eukprot:s404_g20.t1
METLESEHRGPEGLKKLLQEIEAMYTSEVTELRAQVKELQSQIPYDRAVGPRNISPQLGAVVLAQDQHVSKGVFDIDNRSKSDLVSVHGSRELDDETTRKLQEYERKLNPLLPQRSASMLSSGLSMDGTISPIEEEEEDEDAVEHNRFERFADLFLGPHFEFVICMLLLVWVQNSAMCDRLSVLHHNSAFKLVAELRLQQTIGDALLSLGSYLWCLGAMALETLRYGSFKPTYVATDAKALPGYGGEEDVELVVDAVEVEISAYYNRMQAESRGVTSPANSSNYGGGSTTMSSQERQAKVLAAKQRSHCRACGQLGHWQRDPICPQRGRGKGFGKKGKGWKSGGKPKGDGKGRGKGGKKDKPRVVYFAVGEGYKDDGGHCYMVVHSSLDDPGDTSSTTGGFLDGDQQRILEAEVQRLMQLPKDEIDRRLQQELEYMPPVSKAASKVSRKVLCAAA